jgi:hypothetical protein
MDEKQESLEVLPNSTTTRYWSYGLSHVKHTHTHTELLITDLEL